MVTIYFSIFLVICSAAHVLSVPKPKPHHPRDLEQNPAPPQNVKELEIDYWRTLGSNILHEKLGQKLNTNKAKNIIFFLGDGMSVPTITAARIYQGQLYNRTGESDKLFFETFPYTGMSKTYSVNKQVPDSASTATAYMTGVKANSYTCGVTAHVKLGDCKAAKEKSNQPESIVKWAQDAGKATGVITNTRITHASPSGSYTHIPDREMESDADVARLYPDKLSECDFDIASQLVTEEPGKSIKVLMGGGRSKFLRAADGNEGIRADKNLVEEWKKDKTEKKVKAKYVTTAQELEKLDTANTDYLLGLFATEHMDYNLDRPDDQPELWQMTEAAIKVLQKEKNGFYLFVEGGLIDMAHHDNLPHKSLDDTVAFAKAVETAANLTSEQDTLIVVTADHAHTLSISGYPARGNGILQIAGNSSSKVPYTTLSYANGPGYRPEITPGAIYNPQNDKLDDNEYIFPARIPKHSETHGGDDVVVYARGPWSHLFAGSYEQNYIPIAEAYAAKIGPSAEKQEGQTSSVGRSASSLMLLFCSVLVIMFRSKLH